MLHPNTWTSVFRLVFWKKQNIYYFTCLFYCYFTCLFYCYFSVSDTFKVSNFEYALLKVASEISGKISKYVLCHYIEKVTYIGPSRDAGITSEVSKQICREYFCYSKLVIRIQINDFVKLGCGYILVNGILLTFKF